jgi:hypothetical protein
MDKYRRVVATRYVLAYHIIYFLSRHASNNTDPFSKEIKLHVAL